jgi:hypothetical protein
VVVLQTSGAKKKQHPMNLYSDLEMSFFTDFLVYHPAHVLGINVPFKVLVNDIRLR